jgi:hypothetical protein
VERTELDGVPVLWVDAPPPYVAALHFRVGYADERLPFRGITHLVEHLAIFAAGVVRHEYNGFVAHTDTVIWAAGEPDEALAFVSRCAQALQQLPFDRLEGERRVLRTEAATGGLNGRLLDLHFGAATLGLATYDELGLRWLGADDIAGWAAGRFTAGNVAVALSGPPPEELSLGLAPGDRIPEPAFEPLPPSYPVHVADGAGGVVVSMVTERSTALNASVAIVGDRLRDRLRHELAVSYAPYGAYERVGADHVHVTIGSDCEDHRASEVQDVTWRVLQEFAEQGATAEELELHRQRVRQSVDDPQFVRAELTVAAEAELRGQPASLADEWLPELDALDPAGSAAALQQALSRALVLAPTGVAPPADGFGPPRGERPDVAADVTYRRRRSGLRRPKETVAISDAGLLYTRPDGSTLTLAAEELVCGVWFPDDSVSLIERGGAHLQLYPSGWEDGGELIARMRGLVGEENVVPCGDLEITREVHRLAHEHGVAANLEVADALHELPGLLHDTETPAVVTRADHGGLTRTGLLAVTSQRLLWVRISEDEQVLVEHPAAEIRHVTRDWGAGSIDSTVQVRLADTTLKFDVPSSVKDVVVEAIDGLVAAASS